jgi:hypothetical protein
MWCFSNKAAMPIGKTMEIELMALKGGNFILSSIDPQM